jgi:hypothetical protein
MLRVRTRDDDGTDSDDGSVLHRLLRLPGGRGAGRLGRALDPGWPGPRGRRGRGCHRRKGAAPSDHREQPSRVQLGCRARGVERRGRRARPRLGCRRPLRGDRARVGRGTRPRQRVRLHDRARARPLHRRPAPARRGRRAPAHHAQLRRAHGQDPRATARDRQAGRHDHLPLRARRVVLAAPAGRRRGTGRRRVRQGMVWCRRGRAPDFSHARESSESADVGAGGWVGITGQGTAGIRDYDLVGVGTDGDEAPTRPV